MYYYEVFYIIIDQAVPISVKAHNDDDAKLKGDELIKMNFEEFQEEFKFVKVEKAA